MIDDLQLAWLAGLFEGEGHIGVKRSGSSFVLRCAVAMTDAEVVGMFQERWPASFVTRRSLGNARRQYRWEIYARKAETFLLEIQPFVRSSRVDEKVAAALEFQRQKLSSNASSRAGAEYRERQAEFFDLFRRLNATGVRA